MRLGFFILLVLIIGHLGLSLSELLSCWVGNIVGNTALRTANSNTILIVDKNSNSVLEFIKTPRFTHM